LYAKATAFDIDLVSVKLKFLFNSFFILLPDSGNKTIFFILYLSKYLINSLKSYHLSVHHRNIVQIWSQNVFIASIVLSGVVDIESSIKVILLYVHMFSNL
jgi:hypothetical protein